MKKIFYIICLLFITSMTSQAQEMSNKDNGMAYESYGMTYAEKEKEMMTKDPLIASGKFLKNSATFDAICVGLSVGAASVLVATQTSNNNDTKKVGGFVSGVIGVTALACYVVSVKYKWKSGKCLEFYGNSIKYKF